MDKKYNFIVETDSYAGNFEREICAYMTGHIGECEVGEEERDNYLSTFKKEIEGVIRRADSDDNCRRPVTMISTDRCKRAEALEIYFEEMPNPHSLEIMKKRAHEYAENNGIKIIGFLLKTISINEDIVEI